MATIDFPTSPINGQLYIFGLRTWQWNGSGWALVLNQSQIVSVFVPLGGLVNDSNAMPGAAINSAFNWHLLNYV